MKLVEQVLPHVKRWAPPAISYGIPAALLLLLVVEILADTLGGVEPAPQIPPHGYVASENAVQLYWRKGDTPGKTTVEVARGADFENPVFSAESDKNKMLLPPLDPGVEYCWRVRAAGDSGGRQACFTTAEAFVAY